MVLAKYPKVLELLKLSGNKGFRFIGESGELDSDGSGACVGKAGDINNDGFDDVFISAPRFDFSTGLTYVVCGKNGGWGGDLSHKNNSLDRDIVLEFTDLSVGGGRKSLIGFSVSGLGDVNGDLVADFIVGAPLLNNEAGQSYIVFGKSTSPWGPFNLISLNGSNGFKFDGITEGDWSGVSVGAAGDFNSDGFNDIIIGTLGDRGRFCSYVLFGKSDWTNTSLLEPPNLNGRNGFAITFNETLDRYHYVGISVSSAGDINGDNVSDLLIGLPGASPNGMIAAGCTFVIFGNHSISGSSLELSSLDGNNGFVIYGEAAADNSGYSVSSAGDFNNDGINDILIGSPGSNSNSGRTYVVFGKINNWDKSFALSNLNGNNGFAFDGEAAGDSSGFSVNTAGDVNGDGISDIIIGAYLASPGNNLVAGRTYLVFGNNTFSNNIFKLSNLDGHNGFAINGEAAGDNSGYSVSGAGDVNGDGLSDLVIGAPNSLSGAGTAYIITNATNQPPFFLNTTHLKIGQGQTELFSSQNIKASDDWTLDSNLLFIINNLQQGQFFVAAQSVLSFTQGDVSNEKVTFMHDGSGNAPSFEVTVSDGILTAGPQATTIDFAPNPSNDNTRTAVTAGVVGGLAGAGIFGALYLRSRAKRQLEKTINALGTGANGLPSDFQRTVLLPIAKAIFEQIKITGFMYYINQATTTAYVQAIEKVVEELQKQGMDFDLKRRGSTADQEKLFKTIAEEIKRQVLPRQGRCSTHPFTRFFCAEVTPEQIQEKAARIASQVQLSLPLIETSEVERGSRLE